jgi:2-methylcitrate dehydratase PrpD
MGTTLERMAAWVAGLRFEDIPARVLEKAKLQVMSMLAAVYAGSTTRQARVVRQVSLASRASGRATALPFGDKSSPTVAVVANAAASMALDFDDFLFLGHTGHSAVLASLALAEERGLSGRELLRAQVAANELGGRLGASVLVGPQNGQLWTHLHAPTAAAAGAILLGLDAAATAHALAISLYQPPMAMWPGFMGPDSKLLSAAMPARDGLTAASLASWGLTGPLDILDSPEGFGARFAYQFLPGMLTGLGQSWVTDTLSYKLYPGCAYVDAALEALFELMAEFQARHGRALEPADVQAIRVRTSLLGAEMDRLNPHQRPGPLSAVRVNFSLPLSLSVALKAGRLTPADLDETALAGAEATLRALADRIEVRHDLNMSLSVLSRLGDHLPMRALLRELDLGRLLHQRPGLAQALGGGLRSLRASDVRQLGELAWARGPGLARQGLGRLWGEGGEPAAFDLGQARFEAMPLPFPAEVELELRGGRRLGARVELPRGVAGRDLAETRGLVRRKLREAACPFVPEDRLERAIQLIEGLERLDHVEALTELLSPGS